MFTKTLLICTFGFSCFMGLQAAGLENIPATVAICKKPAKQAPPAESRCKKKRDKRKKHAVMACNKKNCPHKKASLYACGCHKGKQEARLA